MKLITCLLILIIFPSIESPLFSQDSETKYSTLAWSEELHDPGLEILNFVNGDDGTVYLVRDHKSDHYSINSISPSLQTGEERDLVYEEKDQKLTVSDVFHLKNELACLAFVPAQSKFNIVVFPIDPKSFEQKGPSQIVFGVDREGSAAFYMKKYFSPLTSKTYDYAVSSDETKVVVYNKPDPGSDAPIEMVVFDQSLKKLWSKQVKVPITQGKFTLQNVIIDNSGSVYCSGAVNIAKTKTAAAINYQLLLSTKQDGKTVNSKVEMEGKFITSLGLTFDANEHLVCAGFYSDKSFATTTGVFYQLFDGELHQLNQQSKDILVDLKNQMFAKADQNDHDVPTLPIIYIAVQSDGDLILTGEHSSVSSYSSTTRTSTPVGGGQSITSSSTSTYVTFYASGAVVVRLNSQGEFKFATLVPIAQKGPYADYFGCAIQVYNGRVFVIYNDNTKNATAKNGYSLEYYDGKRGTSEVAMAVVNPDGALEKFKLIGNKDLETSLVPKRSQTISDDKLLVYGDRVKNYKLGIVTFK